MPWEFAISDVSYDSSERGFLLFQFNAEMRQARVEFPGEQDVGRRVLLCVRPDGSSEPVSFISDATHVKCWCPGLQALLTDQDIQDEYRVKIPADVKQKLARYVQAFVPALVCRLC